MNKYILGLVLLFSTSFIEAQATDDNEINIDQQGDTLTLLIDQVGYGNKMGLDNFASSSAAMVITGSTLNFNIDQIGNENLLYGPFIADTSDVVLEWTGDSNVWDWNVGYQGSADDANIASDITGDSNTMDLDIGYFASAERLDFDLTVIGDSNVFDVDIDVDDAVWNTSVTGGSNNINTLQKDGAEHEINLVHVGSGADIDINQISGTCGQGISTCNGIITLDIDSENATIQINQKDTANDS